MSSWFASLSGTRSSISWLRTIVAFGFISGVLLSFKLWTGARLYPLVPISPRLPEIPFPLDFGLFFGLILLALLVMLSSKPRFFLLSLVTLTVALGLFDQSRWQPWVYQYVFMLAALGLFSWRDADIQGQDDALNTCRLIVAGIYFWSGLQKLNVDFIINMVPWVLDPVFKELPHSALVYIGSLASMLETGIGLGLLTKRFRRIAVALAIGMHSFILLMIGPLGRAWNSVIWPWNLTMIGIVWILFRDPCDFSFRRMSSVRTLGFQTLVFILFAIMPLFSFFNRWDSYLSFALYSGNNRKAEIFASDEVLEGLPDALGDYTTEAGGNQNRIDINDWSFGELNVAPYPETRVFKSIANNLCRQVDNSPDIELVVHGRTTFLGHDEEKTYRCQNLQGE